MYQDKVGIITLLGLYFPYNANLSVSMLYLRFFFFLSPLPPFFPVFRLCKVSYYLGNSISPFLKRAKQEGHLQ